MLADGFPVLLRLEPMRALLEGEPLALLRIGTWRFSVPLQTVTRVLNAAMPVAIPDPQSRERGLDSAIRLAGRLIPVVYASVLFGEQHVELRPDQKMVLISTAHGEVVLWVDALEDVLPFAPLSNRGGGQDTASDWAMGFTAGDPAHAVLDVDRLRAPEG